LQQIGEGGMGTVWMAEQQEPVRRLVALQVIKAGLDSAQVVARFEAERQALALMDHANIAKVLDAGTTAQGRPFFVMDLVKGIPITRYCDEHRLTPRQRLELFVPVCQALQHAHQKGIIHRDLKPSNVLVAPYDGKPVPKVIDFGVAKATGQRLTERTLFTAFGAVVGTLEYMSPEQAELNNQDIDTRSDVYSLGVLLYELLTGTTPLSRERLLKAGFTEMLHLIREEEPPKPSTRLSASKEALPALSAQRQMEPAKLTKLVKGELDWIVMKALEKDRGRRYETANGLARDLERYLHDEPVEACPPSAGYRLGKLARKHKRAIGTATAFVVLLAAGVVVSTVLAVRATGERDRALEAEQKAVAERERADAINDFLLHDLLAQASTDQQAQPDVKVDPNITVRTLLDRASARVGRKFAKQPLVETAIRLTLGQTYRSLHLFPEAEKHLERAVELRRQAPGSDNPETWTAMSELAQLYIWSRKWSKAEALALQVVEARRRWFGEEHPDTLTALGQLAPAYLGQGKLDKGEPLLTRLVEVAPRVLGEDHRTTIFTLNDLAGLYVMKGEYDRAEPLYLKAPEINRRLHGPEHRESLFLMNNLAMVYGNQARYAEAQLLTSKSLETARRVLGTKHDLTLNAWNQLAALYGAMGQWNRYAEEHAKLLELLRSQLGEENQWTLISMNNQAYAQARLGQYDQAELLFLKTLELERRVLGNEHDVTLQTLANLGEVYHKQARLDRAASLLRECLALREKKQPNSFFLASNQSVLGRVLAEQKKYTEAEALLLAGYAGLKANAVTTPFWWSKHYLPDTVEWLVQLYDAWGKPDEAAKWRQELEARKKQ
jgi:non-specific serine/threonine protein kinase/serine/threonine-protein kinase